ncbi:uncharacterized protein si:dkey-27h10.2 isoform X5 [Triplophysa rosa]|uniref:uncharacterized protein si:dkey-27h10.2 isoform X5 n=1 Tax=Triplophysa rosa TaxID=992332 RepID=UPI002546239C|nr:uncharacterized protein si:dkey-27h10.2 isoform X5 [Triplophysa rosa]
MMESPHIPPSVQWDVVAIAPLLQEVVALPSVPYSIRRLSRYREQKADVPPTQESTRSNYGSTYCCLQKNSRRYSVDLHPKKEEAQIPLSTVDGEVFDSTSVKDMHTFSPVEPNMPIKDPEAVKEAEKPDGEKETAVVKEQSNTRAIVIPEDKAEELTIDLTDGEMAISTKTSIESLDEPPNKNNNNNTVVANDEGHEFTEISLAGL